MMRLCRLALRSRQGGQAIVLTALMMLGLLGGAGLAVDSDLAYFYAAGAERAAAAGALSGVIFLPYAFAPSSSSPAGAGNDAVDRAKAEASRNGFTDGVNATVIVSQIPGYSNRLQVVVKRNVPTVFMMIFGIGTMPISQSSTASYLAPITLGQPGTQLGSTVSQLGTGGYYFLRTEGWAVNRGEGDAFTPDPTGCGAPACDSSDVHAISAQAGVDTADPSLPARGGYNYRLVVPVGSTAHLQVYNAAFAPDNNATTGPNFCENWNPAPPTNSGHSCSPGASYYYHEDDSMSAGDLSTPDRYSTMEYTVFQVNNEFARSDDTVLSQMKVKPIDARNFAATNNQYKDVVGNKVITQTYSPATGAPTNMQIYHSWADIQSYQEPTPNAAMVTYTPGDGPNLTALGPGEYRLRVDTLNSDGTNPPGNSRAHKGFAVRVTDGGGVNPCTACTLGAMSDLGVFTPVTTTTGGSFSLPLFQLPPDYAGHTINVNIFDPGDISGAGNLYLAITDPSGNPATADSGQTVNIYNLFNSLSNCCGAASSLSASQPQANILAADPTNHYYDNFWLHYQIPVSAAYSPGTNPANWWWSLRYQGNGAIQARDTITVVVALQGAPAHLVLG
ncbi:MAG TPA: hypothetical protein VG015_06785 [Candidatus Dormibacteraeota bacterium]|jgi:hypothetical protein|nr:hypothetical protein [Candidatus Dormibacteraeota bacterium]